MTLGARLYFSFVFRRVSDLPVVLTNYNEAAQDCIIGFTRRFIPNGNDPWIVLKPLQPKLQDQYPVIILNDMNYHINTTVIWKIQNSICRLLNLVLQSLLQTTTAKVHSLTTGTNRTRGLIFYLGLLSEQSEQCTRTIMPTGKRKLGKQRAVIILDVILSRRRKSHWIYWSTSARLCLDSKTISIRLQLQGSIRTVERTQRE